jgi:hypothetical protein
VVVGVSSKPVVPYTPILSRYPEVCAQDDKARHKLAQDLNANGAALIARDFTDSIAALEAGYSSDASFRPEPRLPRPPALPGVLHNGPDFAWFVRNQQTLTVQGHPELTTEWVDYELSVVSTRGGATFDKPKYGKVEPTNPKAGNPLKADLLLVNATDRTPVLGEVKVARDKEPFSALVQLLAYIAHLSTASQYERLRSHFRDTSFPDSEPPRFDGYLLLFRFGDKWDPKSAAFVPSPNTWLDKLLPQSEVLSAQLMEREEVTRHIRRLACLDVTLDEDGTLVATTRWLHEPAV